MKLITITFVLLLISISAFSQSTSGNLTYSRVITKTFSLNSSDSSAYDTVPAGKVWKMESIMHNIYCNYQINGQALEINTFRFAIPPNYFGSASEGYKNNITPLWLKPGDVIRIVTTNPCNSPVNFFYSIIEYNEK